MIARLEILPGPGTAARFGEVTVWAGAGASNDLLSFLIQSARNLASLPDGGRRIADHLAGVLRQRDPEPAVPFVTVGPGEFTPVTLLHGPVQMWDGARWVRPDPGVGWLIADVANLTTILVTPNDTPAPPSANPILDLRVGVVPGGGLAVVLTPASMVPEEDSVDTEPGETGRRTAGADSSSTEGLTPESKASEDPKTAEASTPGVPVAEAAGLAAGASALAGHEAEAPGRTAPTDAGQTEDTTVIGPAPREESLPVLEAQEDQTEATELSAGEGVDEGTTGPPEAPVAPVGIVDLRAVPSDSWAPLPPAEAGAPSPPGSPVVRGLRCPRGHFNHESAVTCANCGLPLDPIRGQGDGPRPVLGVLVGTDRSLWRIDSSYVVGTDPGSDPVVTGGHARALVVPDDGQAQPVHAELRATDWALSVVDRSSRSGTFVLPPQGSDWQRVPPDQPVPVKPGTHVAIGSTVFTFTSPWPL